MATFLLSPLTGAEQANHPAVNTKPSFFQRVSDTIRASRERAAEREISRWLGDRNWSDETERQLMRKLTQRSFF